MYCNDKYMRSLDNFLKKQHKYEILLSVNPKLLVKKTQTWINSID